jgi:hypothetical protein
LSHARGKRIEAEEIADNMPDYKFDKIIYFDLSDLSHAIG